MGFMRRDLVQGLRAAQKALQTLSPLVAADFRSYLTAYGGNEEEWATTMFALHAETEAVLAACAKARYGRKMKPCAGFAPTLAAATRWREVYRSQHAESHDFYLKVVGILTLANAAAALHSATASILVQNNWTGIEELDECWRSIHNLAKHRSDVLVVSGDYSISERVRRRAVKIVENAGATGGWWLNTVENFGRWKLEGPTRTSTVGNPEIPASFYAGIERDETVSHERYVVSGKTGHDMLPALNR